MVSMRESWKPRNVAKEETLSSDLRQGDFLGKRERSPGSVQEGREPTGMSMEGSHEDAGALVQGQTRNNLR